MNIHTADALVCALFDRDGQGVNREIPGSCLEDLLGLVQQDYDEVDRFYIDHETIGGG